MMNTSYNHLSYWFFESSSKVFSRFDDVHEYIKNNLKEGDILITMGAGDVYKVGEHLLN